MGRITVGQLASFLSYANQYTKPFNEISGVVTELQNALACAGRILDLIEETPQVEEDADAVILDHAKGNVTLEHVDFSYVKDQHLIKDFNLVVKPGERVAIVGPTGCGKTTLINLLMRFYDVEGGSIKVDGEDIRHLTRKSLRTSYGMVLQETWLREGTILENIKMGVKDATKPPKHPMHTVLSSVCHRDMIRSSQKMAEDFHRDKNSFYVSQESCCPCRQC